MTIDPRIGMWLSIVLALVGFLGTAGAELTNIFGATTADKIIAVMALIGGAGNAVNAVLHMIPSVSGPAGDKQFPLGPK